jgi:hypothetical protein
MITCNFKPIALKYAEAFWKQDHPNQPYPENDPYYGTDK